MKSGTDRAPGRLNHRCRARLLAPDVGLLTRRSTALRPAYFLMRQLEYLGAMHCSAARNPWQRGRCGADGKPPSRSLPGLLMWIRARSTHIACPNGSLHDHRAAPRRGRSGSLATSSYAKARRSRTLSVSVDSAADCFAKNVPPWLLAADGLAPPAGRVVHSGQVVHQGKKRTRPSMTIDASKSNSNQ